MTHTHSSSVVKAALVAIPLAFMLSTSAFAAEVQLFSNESRNENANALILDKDDTGGDVILQFGGSLGKTLSWDSTNNYFNFNDDVNIQGDLTITGTVDGIDISDLGDTVIFNTASILTNADNIAANATDIADNTTLINQNTSEISTNAAGVATNATDIADNTTLINQNTSEISTNAAGVATNATDIAALQTAASVPGKSEISLPLGSVVIRADGTDNSVNVFRGTEDGANPHEFNRVVSSQASEQDLDLEFKVLIPENFESLDTLTLSYKLDAGATLDIVIKNAAGDVLASATALSDATWSEFSETLSGAVSAGEYVYITATAHTSDNQSVFVGESVIRFNTTR